MKIHQMKEKVQMVTDRDKLMRIAICLSESPVLKNRMLALEIKEAMDDLNKRGN
jgi:hypothetical protein